VVLNLCLLFLIELFLMRECTCSEGRESEGTHIMCSFCELANIKEILKKTNLFFRSYTSLAYNEFDLAFFMQVEYD
jgi:hypothetical protein